jgi:microcystin degradation protein MlrC
MIRAGVRDSLLAGITDPDAVRKCLALKKGDPVSLSLGGTIDPLAESVRIDAIFSHRARMLGWDGEDAGDAVLLKAPGIDILVTEEPCAVVSPQIIESGGIRPCDYRIIAVKMGYLWPKLSEIAAQTILALTPGVSCEAVERMTFRRIRRPSWPMDAPFDWDPDRQ